MFIKNKKKLLIIGAGEAGEIVCRECLYSKHLNFDIVGFIDDNPNKIGKTITGKKVLGNKYNIPKLVAKHKVTDIIIAIPSATGKEIREILFFAKIPGIKVKIVPGLYEIINDEISVKVRDVKAEDLLGRETVTIDEKNIEKELKDKKILITGAAGSIGSEIVRQTAKYKPKEIILIDYNENELHFLEYDIKQYYPNLNYKIIVADIKDDLLLNYIFKKNMPDIVYHAAAFKHVPIMQNNIIALMKNNVLAVQTLIEIAEKNKVNKFIFISTDKAVNPTSLMGVSKRIGEILVQTYAKRIQMKLMVVRFGNVLGSKGSVVPLFKKQIKKGGPVTVSHKDVRRFFMSIKEAVMLVLQAGLFGNKGEIFVLDMGEQIKIIDLAKELISLYDFVPDEDIKIEITGLRKGEKLFEEPLHNSEKDIATKHDKIYIVQPDDFIINDIIRKIKDLTRAVNNNDEKKIFLKIKELVPEYIDNYAI